MEFETGRRSTLARLQLSVQGLAGSLNSAKKVLVASTVLTAAFCGAIFGLTLVANEASKESHVTNGLLTTVDGDVVKTQENKGMTYLSQLSAEEIAKKDFVSFSQDGADRYMQILGVQATASKKVINTIVGAFEVTEEGMTFAGDNIVLQATEADKAARKALCKFCANGRNANCAMCTNGGRSFAVAGRNNMCAICNNAGRNFQCAICSNGRNANCAICTNAGRSNQCKICGNGRNAQCAICSNGRNVRCAFCANGRNGQQTDSCSENEDATTETESIGDSDVDGANWDENPRAPDAQCDVNALSAVVSADHGDPRCGNSSELDVQVENNTRGGFSGDVTLVQVSAMAAVETDGLTEGGAELEICFGSGPRMQCFGA